MTVPFSRLVQNNHLANRCTLKKICWQMDSLPHIVSYQRDVDKGKLTAVESFEKLNRRFEHFALTKGSRSKRQLFKTQFGG